MADAKLEDAFFARRREQAPTCIEDLAVLLLDPQPHDRTVRELQGRRVAGEAASETFEPKPSLTGIAFAAGIRAPIHSRVSGGITATLREMCT